MSFDILTLRYYEICNTPSKGGRLGPFRVPQMLPRQFYNILEMSSQVNCISYLKVMNDTQKKPD